jgi:hypothetical protein
MPDQPARKNAWEAPTALPRKAGARRDGQRQIHEVMIHRYRFLKAVEASVPHVLADLEENVFPAFKALFQATPSGARFESGIVVWNDAGVGQAGFFIIWRATQPAFEARDHLGGPSFVSEFEAEDLDPARAAFRSAVEAWADAHNLNADWVKEEVFSTLLFWLQRGCPREWRFRGPDPANEGPSLPRIHIDEPWSFGPWRDVRKALIARVNAFGYEVKAFAKLTSLRPGDMPSKNRDHYRWAASFQCEKLSPQKIAGPKGKSSVVESTVTKAVTNLLGIIGLEKRRSRRGGSKSKT